jgi:hypothetical protein
MSKPVKPVWTVIAGANMETNVPVYGFPLQLGTAHYINSMIIDEVGGVASNLAVGIAVTRPADAGCVGGGQDFPGDGSPLAADRIRHPDELHSHGLGALTAHGHSGRAQRGTAAPLRFWGCFDLPLSR